MSIYRPYDPNLWEDRQAVIKIIKEMRSGKSYDHFKNKFFDPNKQREYDSISDDNKKRLYVTKDAIEEVISKLVAFCPILELDAQIDSNKLAVLKPILKSINWTSLNTTIYDILESKGDCFLYYYFQEIEDSKSKAKAYVPCVTIIPTEEISDIILDKFGKPTTYIWQTTKYDKYFDFSSKRVVEDNRQDVIIVFEKGQVTMLSTEGSKKSGTALVKGKKGEISILGKTEYPEILSDLFSIIHIKSNDIANCPFSRIPADKYIDDSLRLDQIESDIRGSNRIIGFPKIYVIDGTLTSGSMNIGGYAEIKSDREDTSDTEKQNAFNTGLNTSKPNQAQVKDIQISNDLRSMFNERNDVYDSLHEKAGLTPPSLNSHLASSDSSKVYQQINRRMEQKIWIYVQNIINGFKPFFESILKLNNMYNEETDVDLSFKMPTAILRDSAYDRALTNSLMLKSGEISLQQLWREQGRSEEEIKQLTQEINDELMLGNSDVQIVKANKLNNGSEIKQQKIDIKTE